MIIKLSGGGLRKRNIKKHKKHKKIRNIKFYVKFQLKNLALGKIFRKGEDNEI